MTKNSALWEYMQSLEPENLAEYLQTCALPPAVLLEHLRCLRHHIECTNPKIEIIVQACANALSSGPLHLGEALTAHSLIADLSRDEQASGAASAACRALLERAADSDIKSALGKATVMEGRAVSGGPVQRVAIAFMAAHIDSMDPRAFMNLARKAAFLDAPDQQRLVGQFAASAASHPYEMRAALYELVDTLDYTCPASRQARTVIDRLNDSAALIREVLVREEGISIRMISPAAFCPGTATLQ